MQTGGYYIHHVPGRLRIKIPSIKNHPFRATDVQAILTDLEEIYSASANPVTGSVVVNYDPERIAPDQILARLKAHNYFDETKVLSLKDQIDEAGSKAGKAVGRAVFSWALGRVLDANGLSFLAALI